MAVFMPDISVGQVRSRLAGLAGLQRCYDYANKNSDLNLLHPNGLC